MEVTNRRDMVSDAKILADAVDADHGQYVLFFELVHSYNGRGRDFKRRIVKELDMRGYNGLTELRDLEEKNRIIKDRLLLIGQNLIETKEKNNQDILEIKKEIEIIKQKIERLMSFLETASEEFSKFARKEDLEILSKQAKMFQPLKFVDKKTTIKIKR